MAFVTPVVKHWLEREIAQWVHSMKDRSDDPSHHERTLLPLSYISLPKSCTLLQIKMYKYAKSCLKKPTEKKKKIMYRDLCASQLCMWWNGYLYICISKSALALFILRRRVPFNDIKCISMSSSVFALWSWVTSVDSVFNIHNYNIGRKAGHFYLTMLSTHFI